MGASMQEVAGPWRKGLSGAGMRQKDRSSFPVAKAKLGRKVTKGLKGMEKRRCQDISLLLSP